MPKISIIVAAYNVEMYIEKCLNSLVSQTFKNIEIIVVNDGSDDATIEKVKKIGKKDNRVKIIDKSNEGLIEARKSGLEKATGEYVMFIDGDDSLRKDACQILYNKALKHSLDIVYYNLVFDYGKKLKTNSIYDFGVIHGYEYLKLVLCNKVRANIVLQFIKREFINNNNIKFPRNVTYAEDLAITVSLAIHQPKVGVVNQALYHYYQRQGSITSTVNNHVFDVEKVIDIIEKDLDNNNLKDEYKSEFDFLAYIHLFYYRVDRKSVV